MLKYVQFAINFNQYQLNDILNNYYSHASSFKRLAGWPDAQIVKCTALLIAISAPIHI